MIPFLENHSGVFLQNGVDRNNKAVVCNLYFCVHVPEPRRGKMFVKILLYRC